MPNSATEKIIAENVRIHRARLHLSQARLAERAGISQSYVGKIEMGSGNLTLSVLDDLAAALGVTAQMLVVRMEVESSKVA